MARGISIFQICTKDARLETTMFLYLKYLQSIDPSFVYITKELSNKIAKTFCQGLKWMFKFTKRFLHTYCSLKIT